MLIALSNLLGPLIKAGALLAVLNEIRGLVMAGPVLWGLIHSGNSLVAIWTAICSLVGIALSVILPLVGLRKWERMRQRAVAA